MTTHEQPHEIPAPQRRFWVTGELSLGSILQALVVMAVGATLYVINASNKTDNTAQTVTEIKASMSAGMVQMKQDLMDKIGSYQNDNNRRFDDLSHQVAGLPDQTTTIKLLDSRVVRVETDAVNRAHAADQMHDDWLRDHGMIMQDHSDLQGILNANKPKLGMRN